ncbi:conjugal transfer protein TraI [Algimonas ampicilliniresistens]|uniref:Conjugal transfer protein TraI n=1 Tax=Algimonas ampicilliniresistens TaxID=1298735 RepID=A0ABQ5V8H3_9PROT|nr:TrbI/VirB10 family protein [Algimonas ampicilliniresistens]GLQ23846.1 conjugal transfer protein TraI [Algimonas ampicilliniresistens]
MSGTNQDLQIRGAPPSVKRFNRRVLMGLLGGSALVLMLAAGFALRSPESDTVAPRELYNTTSKVLPDSLNELPDSYADVKQPVSILGPPMPGDIGSGFYNAPREEPPDNPFRYQPSSYDYAPPPSYSVSPGQTSTASVSSPRTSELFFIAHDSGGDRVQPNNAEVDPQIVDPGVAALAALFGNDGVLQIGEDALEDNPGSVSNDESGLSDADIYNPHSLHMPMSPYQVMAGTVIPASLVTALNSDLPGQVIGQVTENVFDTPTGQHLLIPQGSRLLGRYESDIEAGQSRALVVWTRIIRPDGSSLVIESLPGVDLSGHSGLRDRVDRHRGSLFGAAILSSILSIASEIGSDEEDRIVEALRDGGQDTINQAGQRVVTRALQRQPTLRVRPGWRLRVIVNRDLILSPYAQGG